VQQLSFSFQENNSDELFREENFLQLPENSSAINFLKQFFAQKNFATAHIPSILIKGERLCGKTHILHVFAREHKGDYAVEFLDKEEILGLSFAHFFSADHFYILENIDEIKDEELLLRLVNSASEAKAFLVLTTSSPLSFSLKDLTSRLKNIFTAEIKNPSHESVKQLLAYGLSRRQIKLPGPVINFIADHINRTYQAVFDAVKLVELFCQESGENLNLKKAKEIFRFN
jgi:chromosomal replication initiation ATPase DnaA